MRARMKRAAPAWETIWKQHSLSLVAGGVLLCWLILYSIANPRTHLGSLFGNALADWTGVLVTVIGTKWLFETGSAESRRPGRIYRNRFDELLHEHSLTVFLLITALGLVVLFSQVDPQSKWGTVVSNLLSEWSQQLGLVLLTKRLVELHSKESHSAK